MVLAATSFSLVLVRDNFESNNKNPQISQQMKVKKTVTVTVSQTKYLTW